MLAGNTEGRAVCEVFAVSGKWGERQRKGALVSDLR
jgi:hypothetical protein